MNHKLVYTRKAIKDIQRLDPEAKDRIGKTLLRYQEDPLSHAERLMDPALGEFRFRIGDYRIIFDLDGDEIVILRIGHRRDIYKR